MQTVSKAQASATGRGLVAKRNNALTALIFGGWLALLATEVFSFEPSLLPIGLMVGLVYANAFEYFFHRFLLHMSRGFFAKQHGVHHSTWGAPGEPLFVNFAKTPWAVVALFGVNAFPVFLVEWLSRTGLAPGVLAGFVVYFILLEEVHWRIHLGGWLPFWLRSARTHHLKHHAGAGQHFNIFLPLFDWLSELRTR